MKMVVGCAGPVEELKRRQFDDAVGPWGHGKFHDVIVALTFEVGSPGKRDPHPRARPTTALGRDIQLGLPCCDRSGCRC